MNNLSKQNLAIIEAFKKGYRATKDGNIISSKGKLLNLRIQQQQSMQYKTFSVTCYFGKRKVFVHRFVAYQKYGDLIFYCDCVRHLNGNSLDNSFENIEIGTTKDNSYDIPKEIRVEKCKKMSHDYKMVYNESDVKEIKSYYEKEHSYKRTMEKFGINSKGTLWFILNKR